MDSVIKKLRAIWNATELRNSIAFVIAMLIIFRIAAHIPIPGVNLENLRQFFSSNQIFGLLNLFSGGTLENFSVIMLGVGPYITSSIIFQLLAMIVPSLEELQKEGESGQRKINQWTRMLTVPLAFIQAYGTLALLRQSSLPIIEDVNAMKLMIIMLTVTAGTMFLVWIGELISEKNIGNGISLLIFAGIIAGLPTALRNAYVTFDRSQMVNWILFGIIGVITIIGVVLLNEGQRMIPISHARRISGGGRMAGGVKTHLPLRVNSAGMIPIIFAISVILFPPMLAQFFIRARTEWIRDFAFWTIDIFQNQTIYGILYFGLVFGFTYFYTSVIFHPDRVAENLQKQGAFIPGIRPGKETATYLKTISNRILFFGALALSLIAVLPLVVQEVTGTTSLALGGASLLIVVGVAIESMKQIESQLTMREYDKL